MTEVAEKSLIEDVASNIERLFREMWPYQNQQAPMKARENEALRAMAEDLAFTPQQLAEKSPDEQARIAAVRTHEEGEQKLLEEARLKVRDISGRIADELSRITEDTYPRNAADTPQQMYSFLLRFTKAYTREGKQRSAGPVLEYLYSSCDHAYWLWREWIAACMAIGDMTSAERLLAVLTDSSASSTQAHRFNAEGGKYKPSVVVAKGMIALKRDGDLQLACKYAEVARSQFAEAPEAIHFYHAINYVKQEVDEGRLLLSHIATGRNGKEVREQLDTMIPPVALLTGKWTKDEEE
jgi:hypothetical protein